MVVPRRITVHHTGRLSSKVAGAAAASEILGIQRHHQDRARWTDIAYHFLIDRAGRLWEGRPLSSQGAHAGSDAANRGNIGVCLLGNFEVQRPTPEQTEALRRLLRQLEDLYRIDPESVFAHREVRAAYGLGFTECPGRHLQSLVDEVRRADARVPRGSADRVVADLRHPLELRQVGGLPRSR
jgi:hypothetical protein